MPELRPMTLNDQRHVIKLIHDHDEDDAEAAEADFEQNGLEGQFVLEVDNQVVGVTGYRDVPSTDGTFWLSWTYLDKAHQRQGFGKAMLLELIDKLRDLNGRKIFVKVSDYEDPEDGKIYERALNVYQAMGFKEEVVSHDFFYEGESQTILGLNIQNSKATVNNEEEPVVEDEKPVIRFNGLHVIAESDGAYTFSWEVKESKKLFGKRSFSVQDLELGLEGVKKDGGRKVFLTFPSNLPLIHKPLQAAGFKYVGRLEDYYEHGVHEFHFSHDLNNIESGSSVNT